MSDKNIWVASNPPPAAPKALPWWCGGPSAIVLAIVVAISIPLILNSIDHQRFPLIPYSETTLYLCVGIDLIGTWMIMLGYWFLGNRATQYERYPGIMSANQDFEDAVLTAFKVSTTFMLVIYGVTSLIW